MFCCPNGANRGIKTWAMGIALAVLIAFKCNTQTIDPVKKVNNRRRKRDNNKIKCGRIYKPKSQPKTSSYSWCRFRYAPKQYVSKLFQRLIAQTNKYLARTHRARSGPQSIDTNKLDVLLEFFSHSSSSVRLHRASLYLL